MISKSVLPAALASIALSGSALALTDDDLTPAALAGKTLTFTIESGTAPLATSGTWTGTFETSPANGFTIIGLSGGTANASGTRTYIGYVGGHAYTIDPFITGQAPSTLTLWISEGRPRYYVDFDGTGNVTQFGGFTIGTATTGPEISVQQPENKELTDGSRSKKSIGTARVGKSVSKKFTIENTGSATLKNIAITIDGKNKSEFTISALGKTSVAKKTTTTFVVTFKPKSAGVRNAAIHIKSNDKDENPFDIKLTGVGAE